MHQQPASVNLEGLIDLFYEEAGELGRFTQVQAGDMPRAYRQLLAHENHMTVTVEARHGMPVDVVVLDRHVTASHYARKIVLCRQRDHEVVQFGIMRLKLDYLSPEARTAVEREDTPLGRILIEHDVLRSINLVSLYRVAPGRELCHFFGIDLHDRQPGSGGGETFGRTAVIFCNDEPAVELLEIVAPER
jgi:chorismate-pyruvate lyase